MAYISVYLRACGHDVECARDMAAALMRLDGDPVDVLISDIGLPDGDGWQLMERVCRRGGDVPFGIAMSGYGQPSDIEKSLNAGFQHHLVKPFLPEELELLLRKAAGGGLN